MDNVKSLYYTFSNMLCWLALSLFWMHMETLSIKYLVYRGAWALSGELFLRKPYILTL